MNEAMTPTPTRPEPTTKPTDITGRPLTYREVVAELRQRNTDLSYMAGERDILLAAIEDISDYDDGTKIIHGECGGKAGRALDALKALRERKLQVKP